jgi:hypothetical protein
MLYTFVNNKHQLKIVYSFVWVWNLVSVIKVRTDTEGTVVQVAEKNIWTEEGWNNERLEKIA